MLERDKADSQGGWPENVRGVTEGRHLIPPAPNPTMISDRVAFTAGAGYHARSLEKTFKAGRLGCETHKYIDRIFPMLLQGTEKYFQAFPP
jgi:hypothetical protein